MVTMTSRGTGSSSMFEPGAEPWLEQARGRGAVDDALRRCTPAKPRRSPAACVSAASMSRPFDRLDLDRRLARDLALPG